MRNLILTCTALLALSYLPAMAQTGDTAAKPDIDALCATTACRTGGFEIMIAVDAAKYTYVGVPVNGSPYVTAEGDILIFPGEALLFQFDGDSEHPGRPKFVRAYAASNPAKIDIDGKLADDPANGSLPAIPHKNGTIDLSALPPNSLLIDYGQHVDGSNSFMMMDLEGTFTKTLKLDATMMALTPGKAGYRQAYTSTCPIHPMSGTFESWPNPIGPMFLGNVRLASGDEATTCK